jgi:hypothetical protein
MKKPKLITEVFNDLLTGRESVEELLKTSLLPNSTITHLRPDLHLEPSDFDYDYLAIAETEEVTYYLVRKKDFVFFGLSNYRVVPVKKRSNSFNLTTSLILSSLIGTGILTGFLCLAQLEKGKLSESIIKTTSSAMLVLLIPLAFCPFSVVFKND